MSVPNNFTNEHGPQRITVRDMMSAEFKLALNMFDKWWGYVSADALALFGDGTHIDQPENFARSIFIEGFLQGIAELKPKPKPIEIIHGTICPTCDRLIDPSLIRK